MFSIAAQAKNINSSDSECRIANKENVNKLSASFPKETKISRLEFRLLLSKLRLLTR